MSKEITTEQTSLTGATLYATIDHLGQRWNGSAFENVLAADWATYSVAMTEATGTGFFSADMPAGITSAGVYAITVYQRAGGSAATTDAVKAAGSIMWSGSAEVFQAGDSFTRIGSTGSGLTSLSPAATALSTANWTNTRAGNLDNLDAAVSTRSTYAGGAVASVAGAVGSVTAPVTINLTQALGVARNVGAVADTSLTLNDGFHCAVAAAAGKESVSGTTYLVQTPSTGTTLRSFTLDSATAPTSRS